MKKNKKNPLQTAADEVFWSEYNARDYAEERYIVFNRRTGEIIFNSARLTKERRKVKV